MPAPKRRWERGRWLLEAARDGWTDRMDGCDPPPGAGPTTAHPSPLRLPKSRSPIGPRRLSPAPSQGGGSAARPALAIGRKIRQGGGKAGNSAGPAAGYALLLPTGQLGQERPPSIRQSPLLPHAHGRETEAPRRLQMWVLPPASPPAAGTGSLAQKHRASVSPCCSGTTKPPWVGFPWHRRVLLARPQAESRSLSPRERPDPSRAAKRSFLISRRPITPLLPPHLHLVWGGVSKQTFAWAQLWDMKNTAGVEEEGGGGTGDDRGLRCHTSHASLVPLPPGSGSPHPTGRSGMPAVVRSIPPTPLPSQHLLQPHGIEAPKK